MHKYSVYKHPLLGYEAIKQGFSWPAFFFTWIWAFVKKLLDIGVVLLIAAFIANGISLAGAVNDGAFISFLVSLIPMIVAGVYGNKWRERSMNKRGYNLECTVIAASPDGALAEATKSEEERQQYRNSEDNKGIKQGYKNSSKKSLLKCESCGGVTRINHSDSNRVLCASCFHNEKQ